MLNQTTTPDSKSIHPISTAILLGFLSVLSMTGCDVPNECSDDLSCRRSHGPTAYCADDGICDIRSQSEYTASPCNFETVGPVFEKNTFNVGVVLALDKGAPFFGLIEPIAKAIKLAQNDINVGNGINGVKMGLVFCNTDGNDEKALAATKHLSDMGIQAIIGPDFSGYTITTTQEVLVPNGILAISPSATANALSGLADNDLFWRTVARDAAQTQVLGDLIQFISTTVLEKNDAPRIAMLYREDDAYANGLQEGTIQVLPEAFLDSKTFISKRYPNAGKDQGNDYSQVAIEVSEFKPDIVLVWGLVEVWDIIDAIDRLMEQDNGRTDVIYVTADGGKDAVKAANTVKERTSLSSRVWGTAPTGPGADTYLPYKSFGVRWQAQEGTDATSHPFIANAYDAVYLLALAAAGAGNQPTGTQLAEVMRRLTTKGAPRVVANQQDFPTGVGIVTNGGSIDFEGASGPIEFDKNGDPVSTNVSLWCVVKKEGEYQIEEPGTLFEAGVDKFQPQRCDQPSAE